MGMNRTSAAVCLLVGENGNKYGERPSFDDSMALSSGNCAI